MELIYEAIFISSIAFALVFVIMLVLVFVIKAIEVVNNFK
jgi:hypothetical protein